MGKRSLQKNSNSRGQVNLLWNIENLLQAGQMGCQSRTLPRLGGGDFPCKETNLQVASCFGWNGNSQICGKCWSLGLLDQPGGWWTQNSFLKLWEKTTLSGDSVGWSKRPISSADYIVVHELCNYHRQDKRKTNCSQTFPSLGRLDRDRQQSSSETRHWQVIYQLQICVCLTRLWVWLFMRWSRYIYCDRLWWADFAWRLATWRTGRQSWDDAWFRFATSYKSSGWLWFCLYAFICSHLVQGHVTARALQPPTNQPTGHQMSWQGLAQNDQKNQFSAKFGCFWAKNPNF